MQRKGKKKMIKEFWRKIAAKSGLVLFCTFLLGFSGVAGIPQVQAAPTCPGAIHITVESYSTTVGTAGPASGLVAVITGNLCRTISGKVNWGDGNTDTAITSFGSNSTLYIRGTHVYSTIGTFTLTVTVSNCGNKQTAYGTVDVSAAP